MMLLGIETSCDETSVAIIKCQDDHITIRSTVTATSLSMHAQTGGIIPENAAREQMKYMLPVLQEALTKADVTIDAIDALAVTYGPGLIGSLLIGVETARTLAYVLHKPLIPVNHMLGHVYANFLSEKNSPQKNIAFPFLALVVSGGHTDLLMFTDHEKYRLLGGTRDDAAGEAYDKIGRLLGLPYPAGPIIEELAKKGDPKRFRFPRPLIGSDDYDFSFSGLKTAVLREVTMLRHTEQSEATPDVAKRAEGSRTGNDHEQNALDKQTIADISRATQDAIIDVLVKKTFKAAKTYNARTLLLSGGVAANQTLQHAFVTEAKKQQIAFSAPSKQLCTDNAAMIAAAAYYQYHPLSWQELKADPELYFD